MTTHNVIFGAVHILGLGIVHLYGITLNA